MYDLSFVPEEEDETNPRMGVLGERGKGAGSCLI